VLSRVIDLVRFASDASPYCYVLQVIVWPKNIAEVQKIFRYCTAHKRHATFRVGGTSLCGQSQSGDILIDVRHDWKHSQVLDEASVSRRILGRSSGMQTRPLQPTKCHSALIQQVPKPLGSGECCRIMPEACVVAFLAIPITPWSP